MGRVGIVLLTLSLLVVGAPASAQAPSLRHVTTLAYEPRYGQELPFGTDIELGRVAGRDYAFAGTYRNGLQIVDVTDPEQPRIAAVYDCAVAQGDIQLFRQGSRTLVSYTADDIPDETFPESGCFRDLGITEQRYGTFLVDVTDPTAPRTAGFVEIAKGSHNQTVHPNGRYLYNSNADLVTTGAAIEIVDIADPAHPRTVGELPLLTGLESHDITFSADGTRAYSAVLTHTLVLDTSDPEHPRIIGRIVDPAINIHHQADPITMTDALGVTRTFLVVSDELAGAAGNGACPGGGLHVYDITGRRERAPVKVGTWLIPEVRPAIDNPVCTAHVFRLYPEQRLMTIAWYDAGVRVVDLSGLAGQSGMREIGHATLPDANTWSAKTNGFAADGSFYLFANDIHRGLDVYRFSGLAEPAAAGRFLSPSQALSEARARGIRPVGPGNAPVCLLLP